MSELVVDASRRRCPHDGLQRPPFPILRLAPVRVLTSPSIFPTLCADACPRLTPSVRVFSLLTARANRSGCCSVWVFMAGVPSAFASAGVASSSGERTPRALTPSVIECPIAHREGATVAVLPAPDGPEPPHSLPVLSSPGTIGPHLPVVAGFVPPAGRVPRRPDAEGRPWSTVQLFRKVRGSRESTSSVELVPALSGRRVACGTLLADGPAAQQAGSLPQVPAGATSLLPTAWRERRRLFGVVQGAAGEVDATPP